MVQEWHPMRLAEIAKQRFHQHWPTYLCPLARTDTRLLSILPLAMGLSACTALDPYAEKFERVAVGTSRASVMSIMGTPSGSSSLQVPMVSLDSMTWRAPLNGKLYIVVVAMDRVVAKSAIQ